MKKNQINFNLIIMSVISIILMFIIENNPMKSEDDLYNLKINAATSMKKSMEVIYDFRLRNKIDFNLLADPNKTGLIGAEYTEITTTLGPIEVKRTTTNPDFASVMVQMFYDIGLKSGDLIAVGASGSFPALAIAIQCAANVMGIEVISILSIGASTYGATNIELTVADIESELVRTGYFSYPSIGASVGGEDDKLFNPMFPDASLIAENIILKNNLTLIKTETFEDSVLERVGLYRKAAGDREISAFINIGGAEVNLGNGDAAYNLPAGILKRFPKYKDGHAGVINYMYEDDVPIINLLNIKEICMRYKIPFDPVPLPFIGTTEIYFKRTPIIYYAMILLAYFVFMSVIIFLCNRDRNKI